MSEEFVVRFKVTYETRVVCEKKDLSDIVCDIIIPEAKGFEYVDDSFQVIEVTDSNDKPVKNWDS